jgi:hypothetical protein
MSCHLSFYNTWHAKAALCAWVKKKRVSMSESRNIDWPQRQLSHSPHYVLINRGMRKQNQSELTSLKYHREPKLKGRTFAADHVHRGGAGDSRIGAGRGSVPCAVTTGSASRPSLHLDLLPLVSSYGMLVLCNFDTIWNCRTLASYSDTPTIQNW